MCKFNGGTTMVGYSVPDTVKEQVLAVTGDSVRAAKPGATKWLAVNSGTALDAVVRDLWCPALGAAPAHHPIQAAVLTWSLNLHSGCGSRYAYMRRCKLMTSTHLASQHTCVESIP
jgi:hypothetical protein